MSDVTNTLEVATDRREHVVTATVRGELDLASADTVRQALRIAIGDRAERVELDLADVSFLDSSGLAVFVELLRHLTVVVTSSSAPVRRVIETTGLEDAFGLADHRSRQFPADATSIRLARRFVADELTGADPEWVDLVTLATSEVASNCVTHARTTFSITLDRTTDGVRVTAVDDGGGVPELQHPDPTTPSGRGLLIVERLSEEWGSRVDSGRTEVWFRMTAPDARGGAPTA